MPVNFLSTEQSQRYGRYDGEPSDLQFARYFHLDDTDIEIVKKRRGDYNRLGFAIQMCTVRFLGTFLPNPIDVPSGVVAYLGKQLNVADVTCLKNYINRHSTRHDHARQIKQYYGYKDFHDQPEYSELVDWLNNRAWLSDERPSVLFDMATSWLVNHKVLLPGVTTLSRLIAKVRDQAANNLWEMLSSIPNTEQKKKLEELLITPAGSHRSKLDRLRRGPRRVSGPALVQALVRLKEIRVLGISNLRIDNIPPGRFKALARYAATAWAPTIARMPEDRRVATLFALSHNLETIALDDALDVLDMLITEIFNKARSIGKKERLRTIRDLDAAAIKLRNACGILIDEAYKEEKIRGIVFSKISKDQLLEAISKIDELARPQGDKYHQEIIALYGRTRRFLPTLLKTIDFQGTYSCQPILQALHFLRNIEGKRKPDMSKAPIKEISKVWHRKVVVSDKVDRHAYTLWVLERLQDNLRRRDMFCSPSERWGDPRIKLLKGKEWESIKYRVCKSLGRKTDAEKELQELKKNLEEAYQQTIKNLPSNNDVRIERQEDGKERLVLTGLDKQEEPASLIDLRSKILERLPYADLPEVLLEIHTQTGFANEFSHISESKSRVSDFSTSVCAVLLSEACNIGFEPLIRQDNPALTRDRLNWIQQNYIRADTLTKANARLVEAQSQISLAQEWGGGDVASADGLRFVTPIRTINAGPNPKYFNAKRGITYYNFSSDQFTGFHGIVIPGTLRDSLFILEGLLEQQTTLRPTEIMADTAGVSDVVFGLFWLLGFQFSPRLADIGKARFWRIDPNADYGVLNEIARHRVNRARIIRNWEDMLRIAGSLKLGTVKASELLRSILRSKSPSILAQAIGDVGRISKTIYMLNYFDSRLYRRRILKQLNRGEGRHAVAREICHGKRGEIRKRYREGQEDQLGALGLVLNVVILWQTLYMDAVLNRLRLEGVQIKSEDVVRLSPLRYNNINFLGRYSFSLPESIKKGNLRDFREYEDFPYR